MTTNSCEHLSLDEINELNSDVEYQKLQFSDISFIKNLDSKLLIAKHINSGIYYTCINCNDRKSFYYVSILKNSRLSIGVDDLIKMPVKQYDIMINQFVYFHVFNLIFLRNN